MKNINSPVKTSFYHLQELATDSEITPELEPNVILSPSDRVKLTESSKDQYSVSGFYKQKCLGSFDVETLIDRIKSGNDSIIGKYTMLSGIGWSINRTNKYDKSSFFHTGLICIRFRKKGSIDTRLKLHLDLTQDPYTFGLYCCKKAKYIDLIVKTSCQQSIDHTTYLRQLSKYFRYKYDCSEDELSGFDCEQCSQFIQDSNVFYNPKSQVMCLSDCIDECSTGLVQCLDDDKVEITNSPLVSELEESSLVMVTNTHKLNQALLQPDNRELFTEEATTIGDSLKRNAEKRSAFDDERVTTSTAHAAVYLAKWAGMNFLSDNPVNDSIGSTRGKSFSKTPKGIQITIEQNADQPSLYQLQFLSIEAGKKTPLVKLECDTETSTFVIASNVVNHSGSKDGTKYASIGIDLVEILGTGEKAKMDVYDQLVAKGVHGKDKTVRSRVTEIVNNEVSISDAKGERFYRLHVRPVRTVDYLSLLHIT